MAERISAYISEITFNNGVKISINQDDIVLFVGPNNAGKSQSLQDICAKCEKNVKTIVVTDVKTVKNEGSLKPLLDMIAKAKDDGSNYFYNIGNSLMGYHKERGDKIFAEIYNYGKFSQIFLARLTTEERLTVCRPATNISRDDAWTNPIQRAAFDAEHAKWLSENYFKAFGEYIMPSIFHGSTIPLCIGPNIHLEGEFSNETERQNEYSRIIESYKQAHTQGDGIKSFIGILLYLMMDYYCTYLIDEPESFLHPPQARIMGRIIGQTLRKNQQAFISTHSEDIIKGLLEVCSDRLKIVRITRDGDKNNFSLLENHEIRTVFEDPLLKYSNIMSSMFHKTVVLCESDSDCKFYSAIEGYLKQESGIFPETLYVHCGGKQRMAKMVRTLKALDIDIRLIPDMDVLNDEHVISEIAEAFGIEWGSVKSDYNILSTNLHSSKEKLNRVLVTSEIQNVLDSSGSAELSSTEISQIKEIIKTISKWERIKHEGRAAIPAGDPTNAFNRLNKVFKEHNIYMVPVGELEGFVREVGGHGPDWVNSVLETYPDMSDPVYDKAKVFIEGLGL